MPCSAPLPVNAPIPADTDADFAIAGVPYTEASIARRKVKFFLIIVVVGNVGLTINAQDASIGIDHGDGVKQPRTVGLIKADGQHNAQFCRHSAQTLHSGILLTGAA